jgi:ATP-dependent exoDNAse (exonuclease V) beta subunit
MKLNKLYEYPASMRSLVQGSRHYDVGQEKLPSVTTILSATQPEEKKASLAAWAERVGQDQATRIKDTAAARGTIMHHILEGWIKDEPHVDLTDVGQMAEKMAHQILINGLRDRLTEYWGLEVTLYYPGLYAGATDVVGMYDGSASIIDFKQSNKPKRKEWIDDYKLQLAAYALAHNEIYGTAINKGVNLICTKDNYFQEFIFEGEEFKQAKFDWLRRVDQYYNEKEKDAQQNS